MGLCALVYVLIKPIMYWESTRINSVHEWNIPSQLLLVVLDKDHSVLSIFEPHFSCILLYTTSFPCNCTYLPFLIVSVFDTLAFRTNLVSFCAINFLVADIKF